MLQENKQEIFSPDKVQVGAKIQMENKTYLVEKCRELVEWLGEGKGYSLTVSEAIQ